MDGPLGNEETDARIFFHEEYSALHWSSSHLCFSSSPSSHQGQPSEKYVHLTPPPPYVHHPLFECSLLPVVEAGPISAGRLSNPVPAALTSRSHLILSIRQLIVMPPPTRNDPSLRPTFKHSCPSFGHICSSPCTLGGHRMHLCTTPLEERKFYCPFCGGFRFVEWLRKRSIYSKTSGP